MRSLLVSICVCLFLIAIAAGDIVYLADGREIKGYATKDDKTVTVKLPDGKIVTFPLKDVLYIAKGPLKQDSETPDEVSGAEKDSIVTFDDDEKTGTRFNHAMDTGSVDPAEMLYKYLRKRPSGPGSGGPGLEELIKTARARIHERQRKVGLKWYKPADFIRRRKAFEEHLAEAKELFSSADKIKADTAAKQASKKNLTENAQKKLVEAAKAFADPLLRRFLLGVAYFNSEKYNSATQMFSRCRSDSPIIAGFWQGLSLSLMEQKVYLNSLNAILRAFMLSEERAIAMAYTKDILYRVPGTMIETDQFKNTKKFIDKFSYIKTRRLSGERQYWLMPGKIDSCTTKSLPNLEYDRLVIRQGIAVPITENRMLVGSDIIEKADYVIVKLMNWLWMVAKVEKLGRNSEIVSLYLPDAKFNPTRIAKSLSFKKGQYFNALAIDIFPSMSNEVDTREIVIQSSYGIQSNFEGGLLPGQGIAPVISPSGTLVGFLASKLKTDSDNLPDRLIPLTTSSRIIKKIKRKYSHSQHKASTIKQTIAIPGNSFIVYAISTEKFEE